MPQGYERREGVQDPNANLQAKAPDSIPVPGVYGPRAPNLSGVGQSQRDLAKALGAGSDLLGKYVEKKKKDWELEGQMMYAEGKTEQEIAKSGNRYTMAGFMTMKARVASNEWMQQALSDIETADKELTSQEYQQKLKSQYKQLTQTISGNDEFTRSLMGTIAENTFPQLVSQQIKSNNAWREKTTFNSYSGMLVSEALKFDPANPEASTENLKELLDQDVSGLSTERHREAVTSALKATLAMDNKNIASVLGLDEKNKLEVAAQTAGVPRDLLAAVVQVESDGDRNAVSPKGAKSEMQVMDKTNIDPGYGVLPARDSSLAERARVGRDYLAAMLQKYNSDPVLAVMAYNGGPGTVDAHIEKMGSPIEGKITHEAFVSSFPFKETRDYVGKISKNLSGPEKGMLTDKAGFTQQMLASGFTPAEITTISSEYDKYVSRQTQSFNKDRIMNEQAIIKAAEGEGNLPLALDRISTMMQEKNYGDSWGVSMASRVVSAVNTYEKEHGKSLEIQNAIATNSVATLSGDKQTKAIALEKQRIVEIVNSQQSMPEEERAGLIREGVTKFLVENNIVDSKWKSSIEATLTGNILEKDGTVKPNAIQAYNDYLYLSKMATPGYASKYLGTAEDLVTLAESYDGGGSMSSEESLQIASEILTRKQTDANFTPGTIDNKAIEAGVGKVVDNFDSFWHFGVNDYKTRNWEVLDYEIEQAKKDPRLPAMIQDFAVRAKLLNPNISDDAAVLKGRNEAAKRADFVMGNMLFSGRQSTIREDMGLNTSEPTALNKAGLEFVRRHGKEIWGTAFSDEWMGIGADTPDFQTFGNKAGKDTTLIERFTGIPGAAYSSAQDAVRGTPAVMWSYDPDRKVFRIDLYANKERTVLLNAPFVLPAKQFGEFANALFSPVNK